MTTIFTTGAFSKQHAALIDRLEDSEWGSTEAQTEIGELLAVLRDPKTTSTHSIAECLVMLMNADLYDQVIPRRHHLDDAIFYAISLAERGSLEQRRLGLLYVAMHASEKHDWQLMLVNTLKKDLESGSIARVLMALSFIIHKPFGEIVPAVSATMLSLLDSKRSIVRLRVTQAITRLLAVTDDGFDIDVLNVHLERDDKDDGVVVAKMQLLYMLQQIEDSVKRTTLVQNLRTLLNDKDAIAVHSLSILRLLQAFNRYPTESENSDIHIPTTELLEQLLTTTSPYKHAIGVEVMRHVEHSEALKTYIEHIIHHPQSATPNHRYSVLAHLLALSPTVANNVLGEVETVYVMETLEHPDDTLRKKAMQVLKHISVETLRQYHQLLLQTSSDRAAECAEYLQS